MSFNNYPEYQEIKSLSWSIPKHWTAPKLAHLLRLQSGDSITSENIEVEGDYAVYGGNGLRGYTDKYNCTGEYILVGRQGALCGNVHVASGKFFASEHAVVVYPKSEIANRYFFYLLTFMNLGQYSVAAAQPGLSVENISQLRINFPPITEQTQIARLLDHEVGKIDALIAEQEKLIALLKEKRQAVISHAVTKGLNPDAPMKESGVEWLGKVPEHWDVFKLGYLTSKIGSGKTPSGGAEIYQDDGVPLIRSQNVYDDGLRLDDVVFISDEIDEELRASRVKPNDILLNITGGSIGRSCLVPDNIGRANVNQHVCIIRLLNANSSMNEWVAYFFKSIVIKEQINQCQNGAARQGEITSDHLITTLIPASNTASR
jgi:type I restriction enzyme S subunit